MVRDNPPQEHIAELAVAGASCAPGHMDQGQAAAHSASSEVPPGDDWIGVILDVIWDVGAWTLCPRHSR
jgi:hypothetical protein